MLKVGLTGGVACGKSAVLQMFYARGAHVLRADDVGHQLLSPGQAVYEEVVERFGRDILNPDGTICRPKLADKVFGNNRIGELNAIIHPAVINREDEWMESVGQQYPHAIIIFEAALMIEAGAYKRLDKLIAVICSQETKVERFALRTGLTLEAARAEVERRMKAQLPDQKKVQLADFVLDNSASLGEAERKVDVIWEQLVAAERMKK